MLQVPDALRNKFFVYGLRTRDGECKNAFDDAIGVHFPDGTVKDWLGTTKPGLYYLKNLANPEGCAILVEGVYEDTWVLGLHQGKYEALVQHKNVSVYRDVNKDTIYDYDSRHIDIGMFGINIHHAGVNSAHVDNWSAGCQVFQKLEDFNEFLQIVKDQNLSAYTYVLQDAV